MKKAIALVPQAVLQSPLRVYLEWACAKRGINLEFYNVTDGTQRYSELFRSHRNVITWNCRMTDKWMKWHGENVLYIENSLLHQPSGIFIDHGGFFSNSNLRKQRSWELPSFCDLEGFTTRNFGWRAMDGGNANGPILVALQRSSDSNMQQEFPLGASHQDRTGAFIQLLKSHLPLGKKVTVRPNPRFLKEWNEGLPSYDLPKDWEVNHEGKFYEVLPKCSALVTVNSTCANEAVTLGVPVAVLGTGNFTGSGAVLECHEKPENLQCLSDYTPDYGRCLDYSRAILARHFLPYQKRDDDTNPQLELWLNACK